MTDKPVRLALAAAEDIRKIKSYTIDQWGHAQWLDYCDRLDALFGQLAAYPALGVIRDALRPSLRSLPVGTHVIWYREAPHEIEVVRNLHGAMDPNKRL